METVGGASPDTDGRSRSGSESAMAAPITKASVSSPDTKLQFAEVSKTPSPARETQMRRASSDNSLKNLISARGSRLNGGTSSQSQIFPAAQKKVEAAPVAKARISPRKQRDVIDQSLKHSVDGSRISPPHIPASHSTGFGKERTTLPLSPSLILISKFLSPRSASPSQPGTPKNNMRASTDGAGGTERSGTASPREDDDTDVGGSALPPPPPSMALRTENDELQLLRAQVRLLQNILLLERKQYQTPLSPTTTSLRGKKAAAEAIASSVQDAIIFEQTKVFGVPLELVMSKGVPKWIQSIATYLQNAEPKEKEKSRYSLKPSDADMQLILLLKKAIDAGEDVDIATLKPEPSAMGGLLQVFLSSMPAPILLKDAEMALSVAYSDGFDREMRATAILSVLSTQVSIYANDVLWTLLDCFMSLKRLCNVSAGKIGRFFGPAVFGYKKERGDSKRAAKLFTSLIEDFPLLLSMRHEIKFALQEDGVVRLRAATILCCARKMLLADVNSGSTLAHSNAPSNWNDDTVHVILGAYPAMCSSRDLLRALVSCVFFEKQDSSPRLSTNGKSVNANTAIESISPVGSPRSVKLKNRLVAILDYWAEKYPFSDRVKEVQKVERYIQKRAPEGAKEVLLQFFAKQCQTKMKRSASTQAAPFPGIKVHTSEAKLVLLQQDPNLIAQQMTLIEAELFAAIPGWQLLVKQSSEVSRPHMNALIARFNIVSSWAISEILSVGVDPAARVATLEKLIDIACDCRRLNNFSTAFAIFGGIGMLPSSRFKLLHNKMSKNHQKQYQRLEELFSMMNNSRMLRDAIKQASGPVIPHLALYTKWLAAIDEVNSTYINSALVNVDKLRKQFQLLNEIGFYQKRCASYHFPVNLELRNMLKNLPCLSPEEIDMRSAAVLIV